MANLETLTASRSNRFRGFVRICAKLGGDANQLSRHRSNANDFNGYEVGVPRGASYDEFNEKADPYEVAILESRWRALVDILERAVNHLEDGWAVGIGEEGLPGGSCSCDPWMQWIANGLLLVGGRGQPTSEEHRRDEDVGRVERPFTLLPLPTWLVQSIEARLALNVIFESLVYTLDHTWQLSRMTDLLGVVQRLVASRVDCIGELAQVVGLVLTA